MWEHFGHFFFLEYYFMQEALWYCHKHRLERLFLDLWCFQLQKKNLLPEKKPKQTIQSDNRAKIVHKYHLNKVRSCIPLLCSPLSKADQDKSFYISEIQVYPSRNYFNHQEAV